MIVEEMEKIKPGNPFLSDPFHMGTQLGKNVTVMYATFPEQECKYLIVVNTETGERIRIAFK